MHSGTVIPGDKILSGSTILGSRQQMLESLRARIQGLEATRRTGSLPACSSGCVSLDRLLPEGGFPPGTLIEWLGSGLVRGVGSPQQNHDQQNHDQQNHDQYSTGQPAGGSSPRGFSRGASGAGTGVGILALMAARQAAARGVIVVFDRRRSFYPPAAAALGMELERIVVVRARSIEEELWALDQALRCPAVAAVWGMIDQLNQRWFRRLQLAVEQGGAVGHLLRPARARGGPSWSYAQFWVEPRPVPVFEPKRGGSVGERPAPGLPTEKFADREFSPREFSPRESYPSVRRWHVELIRCHGSARGGVVELEWDGGTGRIRELLHETHPRHLAAQLAPPAADRRSARA